MAGRFFAFFFVAVAFVESTRAGDCLVPGDWPQFRGRRASGIADGQNPPATWDVDARTNIRWKTSIPGLGHASPVIAGGCLFVVTATGGDEDPSLRVGLYGDIRSVPDEEIHSWRLFCLSKYTGRILWERTVHTGVPKIKRHTKATHANSTPATDGRYIVVFLGSEGLYCYNYRGNLVWKKDLGVLDSGYYVVPSAQWGFGSSPIIYQNMVIVQCDVQQNSFVAAFDIRTGCELWRTPREDVPTWSTPTVYDGAQAQLVVNGYRHAGGYNPYTGEELWRFSGGGDIPVPTPIVAGDLIYLSSAHGWVQPLYAVRASARGEIKLFGDSARDNLAWYKPRDGIYMQTPLVYRGHLYACRDNGVLSCYDAETGERLYRARLGGGGGFTASPVAADGRLYFASEDGDVYVIQAGATFEVLAKNSLGEICMATPAISDGMLIVRTKSHVQAIGEPLPRSFMLADSASCPAFGSQRRCRCHPACRPRRLTRLGHRLR